MVRANPSTTYSCVPEPAVVVAIAVPALVSEILKLLAVNPLAKTKYTSVVFIPEGNVPEVWKLT